MTLKWIAEHFQNAQLIVIVFAASFAWWTVRSKQKESNFRVREAERNDLDRIKGKSGLADAKLKRSGPPFGSKPALLPGINIHGAPHEILGIREDATEAEIMHAYKNAMKQYHPDRIQGQAQDQMRFYQEASAQINKAKETMLEKVRG